MDGYAIHQWIRSVIRLKKGFTLVELVVVITIVGLFTGAITVSVDQTNRNTRLSNAAARALADLRYAQETAMVQRREVNFYVYQAADKYEVKYHDTGAYVPATVNGNDLLVQLNSGEYMDVVITSSQVSGNRLSFDIMGKPLFNGGNLPADELSVMYLNASVHLVIVSSGYSYLSENVGGGGGGCGGGC